MRGLPAGASCFWLTASAKLDCISSPMTSRCTCWPNCWRITVRGALPGRKPFKRAVRVNCLSRLAISSLTRSAGTCTCMRRSNLPILSTENCMSLLRSEALQARRTGQLLEPARDLFAHSLGGHLHLHAALQLADTFHGNLHVAPHLWS